MKFFQIYQFAVPVLCLPLSYWLWWHRYEGEHRLVLLAISVPVVFAYVIPALGTNWLRLWEFNTRFRIGRFRPQHGFLFGTATSLFACLLLEYPSQFNLGSLLRSSFAFASVLAFWNWLYDAYAIEVGFIRVYTRKAFEQADAATVAADYAPILFGSFGLCYAVSIRAGEHLLGHLSRWDALLPLFLISHTICLVGPVLAYVASSLIRNGHPGLKAYEREYDEGQRSNLPTTADVERLCVSCGGGIGTESRTKLHGHNGAGLRRSR